jgi:hypothetical protein
MNDSLNQDEIYVLSLAEGEAPSDFRGDPFRKWPDVAGKLRPTVVKVSQLAGNVKLWLSRLL